MPKKRSNVRSKAKSNGSFQLKEKIYGSLLFIIVAIMPLIVRVAFVAAPPELAAMGGLEMAMNLDFFSYYKGWALGIPVGIIAFYFISDMVTGGYAKIDFKSLIKSPPVVAVGIFLLMSVISAIFSSYRYTSWHGTADRGEGLLILFAYFIAFFAAMYHVNEAKHTKIVMYGLVFSSIIMGLIGFGQFVGFNFLVTNLAALLIAGDWNAPITTPFDIANGTLYNPNTFGKYSAMTAPILLAVALVYDGKLWVKAMFFLGGGLMLIGVLASGSMGGLIGISAAAATAVVTFICRRVYQFSKREKDPDTKATPRRVLVWAVGGVVMAVILVGLYFVPLVNQRFTFLVGRIERTIRAEAVPTYGFIPDGDRLTVQWNNEDIFTLRLGASSEIGVFGHLPNREPITIYDAAGQVVPVSSHTHYTPEEGEGPQQQVEVYTFNVPGYHRPVTLQQGGPVVLFRDMRLIFRSGRIYAIARNNDLIDLEEPVPAWGFYGRETWGSSRGYIWSRTLPLMPARTVIGSGPDTYTMIFPQNDVLGKASFIHEGPYTPIDKAHNVYMQTWITTGGISALALIFLFGYYLFTTFVALVRSGFKEGAYLFGLQFGLLVGISGFCVSAFATDSTIGSSGVFYLLLGLGYGVNMLVARIYKAES